MDQQNNTSGTNTTLLVIILLIIVGFGVWWFTARTPKTQDDGLNIQLTVPSGSNEEAGAAE